MPTQLSNRAYQLLKQVPFGKVTTYKALAEALGTKSYRAIGQIMRRNPYAPLVPCHRVVAADGSLGGFKGNATGKTINEKIQLLTDEGVTIRNHRVTNFGRHFFADFSL